MFIILITGSSDRKNLGLNGWITTIYMQSPTEVLPIYRMSNYVGRYLCKAPSEGTVKKGHERKSLF